MMATAHGTSSARLLRSDLFVEKVGTLPRSEAVFRYVPSGVSYVFGSKNISKVSVTTGLQRFLLA